MEVLKGLKESRCTQGKVREEMKGLVARLVKLEVQMGDMVVRSSKEKVELDQRVSRLEREDRNETDTFSRMECTLEEVRAGLQDCQLSRRNNLVFHGLTTNAQVEETQATLAEHVRHILQSKLGIGRALHITRVARLGQSQPVLGCQPVLVTFLHHSQKDEVFRKAALLPRLSGILITEDLPKASLTSPREKFPVCPSLTTGHPEKEGRVKEDKMGEEEEKHEFEEESEDLAEKLSDQHHEGYEDNISVQQVNLLGVTEEEGAFVKAEDDNQDNIGRVESLTEKDITGEQNGSKLDQIVFDPGNMKRYQATDSNERHGSHLKDIIHATESDDADDSESLRNNTIKSDEKEPAMKSNISVKEFDEEEPEEKDGDENEAPGESQIVNEQDGAVFDFFD